MKTKLIELMTGDVKNVKMSYICATLGCEVHHVRDILHNEPCFIQDAKTFEWSYNASKDDTVIKPIKKDEPNIIEKLPEIKKGYYIKRKQSGLGDRPISWDFVSGVTKDGVMIMINDKYFIIPLYDITHVHTGNPVLKRGELIYQESKPIISKKETIIEKKEIETMETNENTITLKSIIKNLETGNKAETLKKAKSDLETFIKTNNIVDGLDILSKAKNKSCKTKADFIEHLVSYFDFLSTKPVEEFDSMSDPNDELKKAIEEPVIENAPIELPVETKTNETPPEKTQDKVSDIVVENLENMPFILNSINKGILGVDNAINQNQTEIKAMKSTMVISINAMAREINELKSIITNQSETIKTLTNNVKNLDIIGPRVPVSLVNDDIAKKANDAKKQAEEKAQKRLDYINDLTGVDKDIFAWINGKKGMPVLTAEQICFALMDDYTGKETKAGIVRLVNTGIMEKVKQDQIPGFKLAKISDFKGVETKKVSNHLPVEKSPEMPKETPVNDEEKPKGKGMKSKKTGKVSLRTIVIDAITEKGCTIAELMEMASKALEKNVLESSVRGIVGYHLPKAGMNVIKTKTDKGITYKIENE